jgi:hypothetical protein
MWNLRDRIKKGLPATNNLVEVWHGAISADAFFSNKINF